MAKIEIISNNTSGDTCWPMLASWGGILFQSECRQVAIGCRRCLRSCWLWWQCWRLGRKWGVFGFGFGFGFGSIGCSIVLWVIDTRCWFRSRVRCRSRSRSRTRSSLICSSRSLQSLNVHVERFVVLLTGLWHRLLTGRIDDELKTIDEIDEGGSLTGIFLPARCHNSVTKREEKNKWPPWVNKCSENVYIVNSFPHGQNDSKFTTII